jgi:hypothetical protein
LVKTQTTREKNPCNTNCNWAYSQSGYPKGWLNGKMTPKDYFGFLLHLLFHDYSGLIYDYSWNDVMLI